MEWFMTVMIRFAASTCSRKQHVPHHHHMMGHGPHHHDARLQTATFRAALAASLARSCCQTAAAAGWRMQVHARRQWGSGKLDDNAASEGELGIPVRQHVAEKRRQLSYTMSQQIMFQKLSSGYYRLNAEHTRCKQAIAPGVNQMEWKHGSCKSNGFALAVKGSFVGTHEWVKA